MFIVVPKKVAQKTKKIKKINHKWSYINKVFKYLIAFNELKPTGENIRCQL